MLKFAVASALLLATLPVQQPHITKERFRVHCDRESGMCIIPAEDLDMLLKSNERGVAIIKSKANCKVEA
jgi:hypothetical protein